MVESVRFIRGGTRISCSRTVDTARRNANDTDFPPLVTTGLDRFLGRIAAGFGYIVAWKSLSTLLDSTRDVVLDEVCFCYHTVAPCAPDFAPSYFLLSDCLDCDSLHEPGKRRGTQNGPSNHFKVW